MMKKGKYKIVLTVRDSFIMTNIAALYTSGPHFSNTSKDMSNDDKQSLNAFAFKLGDFRKMVKRKNPDLFTDKYYDVKSLNISDEIECSERNIRLLIYAFESSFKEYENEDEDKNYYEIRVHTSMSNEEILSAYHKLKDFYLTTVCLSNKLE